MAFAVLISAALIVFGADQRSQGELAPSPWFGEHVVTASVEPQVRIHVNAPAGDAAAPGKPTRVLIYALPNGNTIEQTLGCQMAPNLDWHYDIQHVAAQVRLLREINPDERLVLVGAEAGGLSWSTWRSSRPDGNAKIGELVEAWRVKYGGDDAKMTLTGHSGGGSFMFGVIEASGEIPACIDRVAFLDANYAFDDAKHTAKFIRWLRGDPSRRLVVIAYDDREIVLDGKKVVGPDGGTFRATNRMLEALGREFHMTKTEAPPFTEYESLDGRIQFFVHPNPQNKILHTALVGDMNGLIHAQTLGTTVESAWGQFGGPRAYTRWIQPEPTSDSKSWQPRLNSAVRGSAFMESIKNVDREQREAAVLREITAGNCPGFLRQFKRVPISADGADGKRIEGVLEVMPDYLAIGSDEDFVRVPMTPQTAQRIADEFGCVLPTRKMVDAIDAAAEVRLAPQPLTEDRESVAAFVLSNQKIEQQRAAKPLAALTIGAKKDVVLSPRIFERADRVVIYGWRQLDGQPIQPLTNVHVNWYVDYSHGVRLVRDAMLVDGRPANIAELLVDPELSALVSDEGPINPPRYPVK